jgi:hypothetical protein
MTTPASTSPGSGVGDSYADIVERLFTEFGSRVPLAVITAVVREGCAQLSCSPQAAVPELLECLARQRLTPVGAPGDPTSWATGEHPPPTPLHHRAHP